MKGAQHIQWNARSTAAANARRELPSLVSSYFSEVRELLAKDPPPRKYHALRLATKRLRYTLELFRPCYGRGLEQRMEALRTVQQRLGDLNDCVAARDLISEEADRSNERDRMRTFLDRRAEKQVREFRREWDELFEANGRERWWTGYLGGAGLRRQRTR